MLVDQRLQSMRKLLRIDVPVSQPGVIILSLPEPAIVHHKTVNSDRSRLFRQRHLTRFIHIELRGLPRVVQHRPWPRIRCVRQYVRNLKAMQQSRCPTQPMVRIAAVKYWTLQFLSRIQFVPKIERIKPSRDSYRIQLRSFHGDPPRPRPGQCSEPHFP